VGDWWIPRNERHVHLDDLGLEQREARQARVAGAQIVERDPEAEVSQLTDLGGQAADAVQRGPLGHLEDDAVRVRRERSVPRRQFLVDEVRGMKVDERPSPTGAGE